MKATGAISAILNENKERVELVGDQGVLLGDFEPAAEEALYRKAATLFDPEEIRRNQTAEGPWSTTQEMLERIRSMGKA